MQLLHKLRTSFSTRLALWVAGFVLVISGIVIFLLSQFSQDVIRDETVETTLQVLENTAQRIDNTLRQLELTARQEHRQQRLNRGRIERLVEENGYEAVLRHSLPHAELYVTRRDSGQLSTFFTGNERGFRQMLYEGSEFYIFTQPIANRDFSLVALSPAEDIYGKYTRMHWVLLGWSIGSVLLLLYILFVVVGRHLLPLHRLADTAQSIANGRLDTPIPDAHHEHEIGRLQNSLKRMQTSLTAYMDEMQQQQDVLSRQNADLQSLNTEAQAYEALKAKFLQSMTDRMAVPVEQVCHLSEIICREYGSLSKSQIVGMQTEIMQATERVTDLLDQLLAEPSPNEVIHSTQPAR